MGKPAIDFLGICQQYLAQGAYGYVGSSTVAYGPATTPNGYADLICLYFAQAIQTGASLGEALLAARLKFIAGAGALDPVALKTLAQFYLLGDSTVQPAAGARRKPAAIRAFAKAPSVGYANPAPTVDKPLGEVEISPAILDRCRAEADSFGMQLSSRRQSFERSDRDPDSSSGVRENLLVEHEPARQQTRIHLLFAHPRSAAAKGAAFAERAKTAHRSTGPRHIGIAFIVREEAGNASEVRVLHQK